VKEATGQRLNLSIPLYTAAMRDAVARPAVAHGGVGRGGHSHKLMSVANLAVIEQILKLNA
jgi:hypothetical protein